MGTSDLIELIARSGLSIASAESLTSGKIASALGAGDDASDWFRGGIVAYADDVKFSVLGVEPGPVVTALCAMQMAEGIRSLMAADLGVAVTGVGGPGPHEGKAPGTVFLAVSSPRGTEVEERHFAGDPADVLTDTVEAALRLVIAQVPSASDSARVRP